VLGKPSPLTANEKVLVAKHVPWGVEICGLLGLDTEVCDGVRRHHTRFDDRNNSSSLFGRIICVADAVATMAYRGDYRSATTREAILAELLHERGKQF